MRYNAGTLTKYLNAPGTDNKPRAISSLYVVIFYEVRTGRLRAWDIKPGENKQVFDFDRFGNLYRKAANNPTTGQQNPLPTSWIEDTHIDKNTNRFTTATGTTYNEAGQVTQDNKFREMGFGYDANGRVVKVTRANTPDAHTVYDALGNRVATKINDVWQYMIYDAFGKLVAEYGTASPGMGGVKYLQQDWQGSVRTVTNSNGFVLSRTDHQAFGETIGSGVGLRNVNQGYGVEASTRQGYGLTENDDASGQQHTWFRKLETQAGRWSSADPYNGSINPDDPQSVNRYSYVGNDPANFVDPSGLRAATFCDASMGYAYCNALAGGFFGGGSRGWFFNDGSLKEGGDHWTFIPDFGGFGGIPGGPQDDCPKDRNGNYLPVCIVEPPKNSGCGVNPVTARPGITRTPYNRVGNLRNDGGGSGEWWARRGGGTRRHTGIDIFGRLGQPVVASWDGRVSVSRQMKGGRSVGYGRMVTIDHGNGWTTRYAHLSGFSVKSGRVGQGDQIGTLGQDGNARGTNPHVHYEIRYKGVPQNPVAILNGQAPCPNN